MFSFCFKIEVNKWKFNDSPLRDENVMFVDGKVIAKAAIELIIYVGSELFLTFEKVHGDENDCSCLLPMNIAGNYFVSNECKLSVCLPTSINLLFRESNADVKKSKKQTALWTGCE